MQILIDDKLSLRAVTVEDAQSVFALTDTSRSTLREWLPWLDMTTKEEHTRSFIESNIAGFKENKCLSTVILFDGKIVGIAGFNNINHANETVYIGYWLSKEAHGHGIMTRATQALCQYAFEELQFNKVEIRAAVDNTKSRAIPERLGFVNEGTIRSAEWLYDHFVDHVVYGMLANEWTKTP
ncbi:GNAT family N-acetyltransferase [Lysinibacillus sp. NPDC097287]|uniref:GNAT family N-acetyltransferase n=1 Tax=Lysinibacillus sp. NPDC097287 TaxID=3364144 RepID=UPI0037FF5FCE